MNKAFQGAVFGAMCAALMQISGQAADPARPRRNPSARPDPVEYRTHGGKLYQIHASVLWVRVIGEVISVVRDQRLVLVMLADSRIVAVVDYPKAKVDGDLFDERVIQVNDFSYTSALGARTVRCFSYGEPAPAPVKMQWVSEARPTNEAALVVWLTKQAEAGSAEAQRELGLKYLEGRGVETNAASARMWLERSAKQRDKAAIEALRRLEK